MKKIKAYIVYGGSPEWWNATLVFENGWPAFSHICSHPCFMRGDLLENRKERKRVLKAMGYEVEIVGEPIAGSNNAPKELLVAFENEAGWRPMADEYARVEKELEDVQS